MYPRYYRVHLRLAVNLVTSRRVGGKVTSEHVGRLGSLLLPEPFNVSERARFWRELEARLHDIAVRRPGRVSPDDRRKVLAGIAVRIPRPSEAELRQAEISAAVAEARLMAERRGKRAGRRAPSRATQTTSARP